MQKIIFLVIVFIFFAINIVYSQIMDSSKKPISFNYDSEEKPLTLESKVSTEIMPYFNIDSLLIEDEINKEYNLPFRFGYPHHVSINLETNGTWDTLTNGDRICRMKINCIGAFSINLIYSDFFLPEGSMFFLYNDSKESVLGAFSSMNNMKHHKFATNLVPGDLCYLEYYEPYAERGKGRIEISTIVHGYIDINQMEKEKFKTRVEDRNRLLNNYSQPCNIDVKCIEGAGWDDEIYSVTRMLIGYNNLYCTGSLINNQRQDFKPYILTAFHCLQGQLYPQDTWILDFGWFRTSCGFGFVYQSTSFVGIEIKSSWEASDFALLEIIDNSIWSDLTIPKLYFNGWDRTGDLPNSTTCLHHPQYDFMKISIDYQPPVKTGASIIGTGCLDETLFDTHWRVVFDKGIIESASSGSPLFDNNHRIIGQAHTTCTNCGGIGSLRSHYGRFDKSWLGGNTPETQLKYWLDPDNTGVTTMDGIDLNVLRYGDQIAYGQTTDWNAYGVFKIGSNHSSRFTVESGGNLTIKAGKQIVIRPCTLIASGSEFLAHIGSLSPSDYVPPTHLESYYNPNQCSSGFNPPKANMIEQVYNFVPNSVSIVPNPFTEDTRISISLSNTDKISLSVYDLLGNRIAVLADMTEFSSGSHNFTFSGHNINSGVYYVVMSSSTERISHPLMLIK